MALGSRARVAPAAESPPATERDSSGENPPPGGLVQEEAAWATQLSDALQDDSDIIHHIPRQDQGLNFWQFSVITFILTVVWNLPCFKKPRV